MGTKLCPLDHNDTQTPLLLLTPSGKGRPLAYSVLFLVEYNKLCDLDSFGTIESAQAKGRDRLSAHIDQQLGLLCCLQV